MVSRGRVHHASSTDKIYVFSLLWYRMVLCANIRPIVNLPFILPNVLPTIYHCPRLSIGLRRPVSPLPLSFAHRIHGNIDRRSLQGWNAPTVLLMCSYPLQRPPRCLQTCHGKHELRTGGAVHRPRLLWLSLGQSAVKQRELRGGCHASRKYRFLSVAFQSEQNCSKAAPCNQQFQHSLIDGNIAAALLCFWRPHRLPPFGVG